MKIHLSGAVVLSLLCCFKAAGADGVDGQIQVMKAVPEVVTSTDKSPTVTVRPSHRAITKASVGKYSNRRPVSAVGGITSAQLVELKAQLNRIESIAGKTHKIVTSPNYGNAAIKEGLKKGFDDLGTQVDEVIDQGNKTVAAVNAVGTKVDAVGKDVTVVKAEVIKTSSDILAGVISQTVLVWGPITIGFLVYWIYTLLRARRP